MAIVAWINHMFCCLWYAVGAGGVGSYPKDGGYGESWLTYYGVEQGSLAFRYFTSFHFMLCSFVGGAMDVNPVNLAERVYTVLTTMVAFVVAACVVSSLTSSLT